MAGGLGSRYMYVWGREGKEEEVCVRRTNEGMMQRDTDRRDRERQLEEAGPVQQQQQQQTQEIPISVDVSVRICICMYGERYVDVFLF